MVICYAMEHRGAGFVLGFALCCALASIYGFLQGAWPFGLVEGVWSAIALRRWHPPAPNRAELRVPPVVVVVLSGGLMHAIAQATPALSHAFEGRAALAWTLFALGVAIPLAAVAEFRRARTTVDPRLPGKSSTLVASGIYRFSRNPMYVGFMLMLCGWATGLANLAAALVLPFVVAYLDRFQIAPEERALAALFGETFDAYCRRVRRWI